MLAKKYIIDENMPQIGMYRKFWVSIFNTDTMERVATTVLKHKSDFSEIKDFVSKINANDEDKKELSFNVSSNVSEADYKFRYETANARVESQYLSYSVVVTVSNDKELFDELHKEFVIKQGEKTKQFFLDLKEEFKLTEEEMEFLFPNYSEYVVSLALFLKGYQDTARMYVNAK